jgi:uncharacterized protein
MGVNIMEDELVDIVESNLFSELPDIAILKKMIMHKLKLNSNDADTLLYKTVLKLNAALFPPITGMELVLTEGCNLACSYCFEKNMLSHKKMPLSIAAKAVDLLLDYSNDQSELNITFFGGEPTLNYPVIKCITEYVQQKASSRNKSVHFNMTSNGTLLTSSMIDYFYQNKIKILISMDGVKGTHDKFRIDKNGKGTFDRVYKNLKLLKEKQPWIGIKMTIMPSEAQHLFSSVLELHEMGVNQFIIGPATGTDWSTQDTSTFLSEMKKIYEWYLNHSGSDLRIAEFEDVKNGPFFGCHAGRTNIAVGIDGQISPCSKILAINSTNPVSKLGDVHFGLINFKNRMELIKCSELRSECERKNLLEDYRGGCYATNYYETKSLFHPNMNDYYFEKEKHLIFSNLIVNKNKKYEKLDIECITQ